LRSNVSDGTQTNNAGDTVIVNYSADTCPKIAWLSPLPPQRSGIANYSYQLLKGLRDHFDVHVFSDEPNLSPDLTAQFTVHPLLDLPERLSEYDEVVYHLGNHAEFHRSIYELAWRFPGTIVLHDYNLSGFMYEGFFRTGDSLYEETLIEGYGAAGRSELESVRHGHMPDSTRFPMSHAIVKRSKKVIVHHRWVKSQFPATSHIKVIPHFAKLSYEPSAIQLENFRARFAIKSDSFLITCLGFVNNNKLPDLQIAVVKRLLDDGYPVQLLFAGEPEPELMETANAIGRSAHAGNIIFTGYLDEPDYFSALILSDVIINLRNPTMGEASGTLVQALAAAKPTIVSDLNQYKEFPDKVCWKLTHDELQEDLLFEYLKRLLSDRFVRAGLSANAADYVENVLSFERVNELWRAALQ
jgi:glycosyltransferase involved in cell wall biosynthesis